MSAPSPVAHFVFVDFENVPSVDLTPIEAKPVHVTLLIGEKQKRLDLTLVRQIHRHASQVALVEVGSSGRNALDLVLAAHLGRATIEQPGANFVIVSKDTDFDPLVAHLRGRQIKVQRHTDFATLPFFGPRPRPPAGVGRAASIKLPPARPADESVVPQAEGSDEKREKLERRLRMELGPRPKRKSGLLRTINTAFGNKLSEKQQEHFAEQLVARGIVTVDLDGRVSYPNPA